MMIGTVLVAAEAANGFVLGQSYDSDTNHQFMDHILCGIRSRITIARAQEIPFFKDLTFRSTPLECVPYKVPYIARAARGNCKEPYYGGRDAAHTTKAGSRAPCSMATVIHLGDLFSFHGHGLEKSMPIRAFYCHRKQSDKQSAERLSSTNFLKEGRKGLTGGEPNVDVHWTAHGHLVYSVMLRMATRATWSELLWREPFLRVVHNLVPYHFFEAARMLNTTREEMSKQTFLHPITYLCVHRMLVHNLLKDASWPSTWPPYVGARMTEYFAEMQMECKRRLGPAHGQGCSDWITSTHINHRSQIARAETGHPHRPRERECPEVLTPEELKRASTIGISVAIQLLALCCPQTIPSTSLKAQVPLLTQQYKNWSASTRSILVLDGEAPDSDEEWRSDEDQHHQGCVCEWAG